MPVATIRDVRRLRFRTITPFLDDLKAPIAYAVTPEVATLAVRRLRRRGAVMFLVGLVLFAGFVIGVNVVETNAEELRATGERTEGVVLDVESRSKFGSGSITVRFSVGGAERVRTINLDDTSRDYRRDDPVTVIYDAANPERLTAPDTDNEPTWRTLVLVFAAVVSLVLMPCGGTIVLRWSRRLRSIRRQGWRYRHAEINSSGASGPWSGTGLEIFHGDRMITAVTVRPVALPIPADLNRSDVLIGGSGKRLTVLFLTGPFVVAARCTR